jgi:hypothetical protein
MAEIGSKERKHSLEKKITDLKIDNKERIK